MSEPFYAEQTVEIDGGTYQLVIDFKAIDATEQSVRRGYPDINDYASILDEIQKPNAPIGLRVRVIWGLLREHHPDLSLEQIFTLQNGDNGLVLGVAVSELLEAAFPFAEKAKGQNPPKPRGASKPS